MRLAVAALVGLVMTEVGGLRHGWHCRTRRDGLERNRRRAVIISNSPNTEPRKQKLNPRRLVVLLTTALFANSQNQQANSAQLSRLAKFVLSDRGQKLRSVLKVEAKGALDLLSRRSALTGVTQTRLLRARLAQRLPVPELPELLDKAVPPLSVEDEEYEADLIDLSRSLLEAQDPVRQLLENITQGDVPQATIIVRTMLEFLNAAARATRRDGEDKFSKIVEPLARFVDGYLDAGQSRSLRLLADVIDTLDDQEVALLREEAKDIILSFAQETRSRLEPVLPVLAAFDALNPQPAVSFAHKRSDNDPMPKLPSSTGYGRSADYM